MAGLKVALFSDSHYEANGVARTTNALEQYAAARGLPLLSVHAGASTRTATEGSIRRLEVARWRATSFDLEHDLRFDLALWRHLGRVRRELEAFEPDVLHFTGPSDVGQLGAYLGYRLGIPMVGSWHTNLHEYAARRLRLPWLGDGARARVHRAIERVTLDACALFYRIPRAILAPNDDLQALLASRTGKPAFLMSRGVDTEGFSPTRRRRTDATVNIGYVGRLSPEKGVRTLATVAAALAVGGQPVTVTIVGEGSEREWLTRHVPNAVFAGVLRGDALADAYADMDLFVFPSVTDTVGNVVLEAMASGVPVVAMAHGGPKFVARSSAAAILAQDERELVEAVTMLVHDRPRRARMSGEARQLALGRTWDRIFDGVYAVYADAVRQSFDGAEMPEATMGRADA